MYITKMRPAIAMIELIFAIVIMGITLLSAPLLMSQASKSGYVSLQQESIAAAASQMGIILTRAWDEADQNQTDPAILRTTYMQTNNAVLNNFTVAVPRPGMDGNASRRHTWLANPAIINPASIVLGSDGGDLDDIDDFNGNTYTLAVYRAENTTTEVGDYLDNTISIATVVAYGDDVPKGVGGALSAGGYGSTTITFSNPFNNTAVPALPITTNIKLITVTLTSLAAVNTAELAKNISLSAFSVNIGTYRPTSQDY